MPSSLDDMEVLKHKHAQNVITNIADLHTYVALKHSISIIGYNTEVYLPQEGKRIADPEELTPGGRPDLYGAPILGDYEPETRTGSLYNDKDHEYLYSDTPDFLARIAFLDPQAQPVVRGTETFISEENTAYTLKWTDGEEGEIEDSEKDLITTDRPYPQPISYKDGKATHRNYCPGDIALYSKLLIHYGGEDLSYFVKNVRVLRNPNAKLESHEALIYLDLVLHL